LCLFKDVWDTLGQKIQGCTLLQQLQLLGSEHASTQVQGCFERDIAASWKDGIARGAHAYMHALEQVQHAYLHDVSANPSAGNCCWYQGYVVEVCLTL
jgi:hypothetical protein